jgi:hypothetical protein
MKTRIELITPEIAQNYLKHNVENRQDRRNEVDELAHKMRSGKWKENGEAFIFDKNGILKDGQHRLKACIKAKHSFNAVIVTDVDPDVMDTIDTGLNRTLADVLHLNGFKSATGLASMVKAIIIHNRRMISGKISSKKVTNAVGLRYALKHKDTLYLYMNYCNNINQKTPRVNTSTFLGLVMHIITKGKTPTPEHEEFIKRMAGFVMVEKTGTFWLYRLMQKSKAENVRLHDYWKVGALIKVYNIYVQGDAAVTYLKFDTEDKFPEVL